MNKKGITLISLVITIIVMAIIAGITITTTNLIQNANRQRIISEMTLIRTKVMIIINKYAFNNDSSVYIGQKLSEQSNKAELAGNALTSSELNEPTYYIYNQETLNSISLEGIKLEEGEIYIVNYADGDIVCPEGVKNASGEIVYRLSQVYD